MPIAFGIFGQAYGLNEKALTPLMISTIVRFYWGELAYCFVVVKKSPIRGSSFIIFSVLAVREHLQPVCSFLQ